MKNNILGITIDINDKNTILEQIIKFWKKPSGFFHIVSVNPENIIIASENSVFKKIINTAQIRLTDGAGIVAAAKLLKMEAGERVTGVGLMRRLLGEAAIRRLKVLLIGGKGNLAESIADCYQRKYPEAEFVGDAGYFDINNMQKSETEKIFHIVAELKPNLILAAFGSPFQEVWLWENQKRLGDCVAMGVGQGFDVAGGRVKRAPVLVRKFGLEWFYRLLTQPWRWRRQLRLVKFTFLVLSQRLKTNNTRIL